MANTKWIESLKCQIIISFGGFIGGIRYRHSLVDARYSVSVPMNFITCYQFRHPRVTWDHHMIRCWNSNEHEMRNRLKIFSWMNPINSPALGNLKLDKNKFGARQLHSIFVVVASFVHISYFFLKNDSVSYRNHNYSPYKIVNFHINYCSSLR